MGIWAASTSSRMKALDNSMTITVKQLFCYSVHPTGPNHVLKDTVKLSMFLDTIQYGALLDLLAVELQMEFAGKLVKKDLTKLLNDCKQLNQQGNPTIKLSIAKHYQMFSTCIDLLNQMTPCYQSKTDVNQVIFTQSGLFDKQCLLWFPP